MAKRIDLNKTGLVEVHADELFLEVTQDEMGRLLARVESVDGGKRILIKQHEEDSRTIVFSIDGGGPKLSLVE